MRQYASGSPFLRAGEGLGPAALNDWMPYDAAAAQAIVRCFEEYGVQIKGARAGERAGLRDYQREWLMPLFGTLNDEGLRQYRTAMILEPKKVGKTYVAAMLSLLLISIYGRAGAEVFSLANSKEQAALVFKAARALILYSEGLQELGFDFDADVRPSTKTIYYRPLDAVYRALAAEELSLHGEGPYALVVDELHAMRDREAIDAIREGMAIWPDPLALYITNMGAIGESAPFWEELEYAKQVLADPSFDLSYLALLRIAPEHLSDDELLEEGPHWFEINRALGNGLPVDFYRRACQEAKEKPSQRSKVLRFHLCRAAQPETAAIPMGQWKKCADRKLTPESMQGRRCAVGLDLSSRWDLTSVTLAFPEDGDARTWLSWSWVPEEMIARIEGLTQQPIGKWVRSKKVPLKSTSGAEIDFGEIEEFLVEEVSKKYDVIGFCYDPKFATQLAQNLSERELVMVEFQPSYKSYTEPWESTEARIVNQRLRHGGDPLINYAASSLAVRKDQDMGSKPVKIDRRKSSKRIDPIVAGLMAESLLIHTGPEVPPLTAADFAFG